MNIILREINYEDYNKGYFELMYEFTSYYINISIYEFKQYIDENYDKIRIIIIYDNEKNIIIGSGSIFKLQKLHNNPISQIEDIIIKKEYQNNGLGKLLIKKLINIGINEFKCYKIILNCNDKNLEFYEKLNFKTAGIQMKYL